MKRWTLLLSAVVIGLLMACSDRETALPAGASTRAAAGATPTEARPTAAPGSSDPAALAALDRVQRIVDSLGSYGIQFEAFNFVLPQWGGSDTGFIQVNVRDRTAKANLIRTGDGQYLVIWTGGQTYFKRATCKEYMRIPGGGPDVLAPFLLFGGRFSAATNARLLSASGATPVIVEADLQGVGRATIEINKDNVPIKLTSATATNNGRLLVWTFSDWGGKFAIDKPDNPSDRGPGGNPC